MTEAEFNSCIDPVRMLEFLRLAGLASDRKLRLFAVGCCRRLEVLLPDQRSWDAVHVAEWSADGNGTDADLAAAHHDAELSFSQDQAGYAAVAATAPHAWDAAVGAVDAVGWLGWEWYEEGQEREQGQTALLRDIFGPLPFRQVQIEPSWRTPAVVALAKSIYEERRFEEMPVLADALEEAACRTEEILQHMRQQGAVHSRGCWCLDLLLGNQ